MASKVLAEETAFEGGNYLKYCNLGHEVVAIVARVSAVVGDSQPNSD